MSNKIGPSVDPWGTPESKIWKILWVLLIPTFFFFFLSMNKRIRGSPLKNRKYASCNKKVMRNGIESFYKFISTAPRNFSWSEDFF